MNLTKKKSSKNGEQLGGVKSEPPARRPRPVILQRQGELPREDWSERCVDMFERLEIIGEGTYGKVFKAVDVQSRQLVALKSVKLEPGDVPPAPKVHSFTKPECFGPCGWGTKCFAKS